VTGRVWIVGESNPYGSDPDYALYPAPDGCAGWRLCCLVLDLPRAEYLRRYERRNLLQGPHWSAPRAREAAGRVRAEFAAAEGCALVLCGAKVAAAFGLDFEHDLLVPTTLKPGYQAAGLFHFDASPPWVLVIPHPSTRCRRWVPECASPFGALARAVMRSADRREALADVCDGDYADGAQGDLRWDPDGS
jgi:hypothetical protein